MLLSDTFSAAYENQKRNRGTPGEWFAHKENFRPQQPQPRIRPEARSILQRSQQCLSMATIAGFENRPVDEADDDQQSRYNHDKRKASDSVQGHLKSLRLRTQEAVNIAHKNTQQTDKWHDFQENLNRRNPQKPYRVGAGTEGLEIIQRMTNGPDWFTHGSISHPTDTIKPHRRRSGSNEWFTQDAPSGKDTQLRFAQKVRQRVHNSGIENALRNRGTADILHMTGCQLRSKICPYGCPSSESKRNALAAVGGSEMARCLGRAIASTQVTDDDDEYKPLIPSEKRAPVAKVRGEEATQWRTRNLSGNSLFSATTSVDTLSTQSAPRRVRPEAEDNYVKSTSGIQLLNCLLQTGRSRSNEPVSRPQVRLRSKEARQVMRRNRGQMNQYLGSDTHSVGKRYFAHSRPKVNRCSELRKTALSSRGQTIRDVLTQETSVTKSSTHGFEKPSADGRKTAQCGRICPDAQLGSHLEGMSTLTPPRTRLHQEAVEYALKHRGKEMDAILKHQ